MNKMKINLLKQKAILLSMYGFMGAAALAGCNTPKTEETSTQVITTEDQTIEEPFTAIAIEEESVDITETILEKYNEISDEKLTIEDIGKIEVGTANLFIENGEYVFDPSAAYTIPEDQVERGRTKGIVTYINRNNKKAIASMGYVDGNLNSIYVKKYFDSDAGYIESDPSKYVLDINESNYKPEVDDYNNVVTYTKIQ